MSDGDSIIEWKGNAYTGTAMATLGNIRAEIVRSKSLQPVDLPIKSCRQPGRSVCWNVLICEDSDLQLHKPPIAEFTIGPMLIGKAKDEAAIILTWAAVYYG